ncbi:MAG: transporter [Alphaproteobacteria bacterium]|nr:transporter [Alphaproteobacteria bacterium]
MKKLLTFTALGTILAAAQVQAAGYHLREQSAAAQGNAYAGATAGAENLSYAYFNAASITRQKGTNINVGGTYIAPKAEMKNVRDAGGHRDPDSHNVVHAAVAPNMAISHQLNDKAFIALALNVPFGMITKYDEAWAGAEHGVTSKITAVTATPMVAYKATDKLSIGAGLQIQYLKAKLTSRKFAGLPTPYSPRDGYNSTVEGDAVDFGWQISSMYEFNENTRIGLSYRSKIQHKLNGKSKLNPAISNSGLPSILPEIADQSIYAHLNTPAMFSMGVFHQINEKWSVMAEYQRVFWSCFRDLYIRYKHGDALVGGQGVREKWRDTNFYAIGASYQIDNQWKWRFGLAYDQSAVRMNHRTPRIPDSDRLWYSTGLNYQYNEKLSFDLAYTYIYAHKAHLDTARTGNSGSHVTAEYTNSVQLFGVSLNYKF